jgi:hypothetical protein
LLNNETRIAPSSGTNTSIVRIGKLAVVIAAEANIR